MLMRIGLISDTHVPETGPSLPCRIAEVFQGVDLILHAGDIYIPSVLDELQKIAPVLAAQGDDEYQEMLTDTRVKSMHVLDLEGKKVWLTHKRPYNHWFNPGQKESSPPDVVVFGHQHSVLVEKRGRVLFVNPGSPTFLHYSAGPGTLGILTIDSGRVEARIAWL